MSASQTFSVTVSSSTPPPNALTITPATPGNPSVLAPETEGTALTPAVIATISGGVPPYNYNFSGQPDGITFSEAPSADGVAGDADVSIAGTPALGDAASSPYTITMNVTDSSTQAQSALLKFRKL
jgi:hypothetical protein